MIINLSPIRMDYVDFSVVKEGAVLIVNNVRFDFARMQEGDSLPCDAIESEWFVDKPVIFENGQLEVTLLFPIPANFSQEQAFPLPLLNVPNGPVSLPLPLATMEAETNE